MKKPVDPAAERRRQDELDQLLILDTAAEPAFDDLCALAAEICGAPIATITFIDRDRRWHKARVGVDAREGARDHAFCEHVLATLTALVVPDLTADPRFVENPLVTGGPGYRFYAGVPLAVASGEVVGTFCVLDVVPRPLDHGQVRALDTLARTVIEQLEARAQARRAEEREHLANDALLRHASESTARRTFFGRMVHDLRGPVNHVLGALDEIAGEGLATADAARLAHARAHGRALLERVGKIIDLMAVEDRRLTIERTEFDLTAALARLTASFGPAARAKGVAIDAGVGAEEWVFGDPTRLTQVLADVIDNALKFTERGGVTITRRREGDDVILTVRDTGAGMTPERAAAIFDAAARAGDTVARRFAGGGLGLPITKEVVESLGGTISCHSTLGVGSTFTVRVPLASSRADVRPTIGLKVLVVDDVTINQKVIRAILGPHRADVRVAASGEEALEIFARETFDVILMDRYMPGMGGVEATRRMRELEAARGSRTPIFGTSAASEASERQAFILAGADETIAKPLRLDEFWTKLNRARAARAPRAA